MCTDWREAYGEGWNQACAADELRRGWGWGVGTSVEMGRAQALVSVAQERRAEIPLTNGQGCCAEEGREGERERGLELSPGRL